MTGDLAYNDPYALHLVVEFSDGTTQRWGPDELDSADVPSRLRFGTSMPGGYRDLACLLLRRIDLARPDEQLLATVTVYDNAAEIVWRGRFKQFPKRHGSDYSVEPGAEGWVAHLSDRKDARQIYRDVDIRRWQQASVARRLSLIGSSYSSQATTPQVDPSTGKPALRAVMMTNWPASARPYTEAWYDASGIEIGSIFAEWQRTSRVNSDVDANWKAYVVAAVNDTQTVAFDVSADQAATPTTGSVTLTASAGRTWAILQFLYEAGAAATQGVEYEWFWQNPAVYGRHGLTLRGTEPNAGFYVSDLVRDAVGTWAPALDTTDVEENTVVVTHVAWHDQPTDAATMVQTFNRNALWDYGVYGKERFFFRRSDPQRLTWTLRLDLGTTMTFDGPTGDEQINGLCLFYQDPSGRTRSVGPPEAIVDVKSDTLRDYSSSNPATRAGILKFETIQLSDPVDADTALLIAQLYFAERSVAQYRGQVVVTGMSAKHPTKGFRPAFEIKAGDYVQIADSQDDVLGTVRKVVDTDYDHDARANTLDLDNRADTVDALLSLLNAELVRVGL